MSNFFIPFIVLLFCYSKMCAVLWGNFKQKKDQEKVDFSPSSTALKANRVNTNKASKKVTNKVSKLRYIYLICMISYSCGTSLTNGYLISPMKMRSL